MLKSKNQVTLFVNYNCNSFYDFRFSENTYREKKVMCQNMGFFIFYMGIMYIHTFNRYPRNWSSCFYSLPPMRTNESHWCLLNLLVKSHFKLYSYYTLLTAICLSGPGIFAQDTKSISTISFIAKFHKSLELNFAQFLTLNPFKSETNWQIALRHKLF